tara:strand:+ start:270 stop:1010 length:741 start_codon:yes stop_codon:yes gene_type:complete
LDVNNNRHTRYSNKSAYQQLFSRSKKIYMKRDTNKKSDLSTQLVALPMQNTFNMLSTLSGKYTIYWLFGVILLTACRDGGQSEGDTIDFARWTNPVTGTVVELPEGWRHSPDTASSGQTVVGYFLPRYAWMKGQYGHISLHHEDLSDKTFSIEEYSERLVNYLQRKAESVTQTVYSKGSEVEKAHFEVETVYQRKRKVLRCLIWTHGDGHFWYSITEMLADDRAFIAQAMPVVDLLVESVVSKPAP